MSVPDPIFQPIAAFRCFRYVPQPPYASAASPDPYLRALTRDFRWRPGEMINDILPAMGNHAGFWGFKTLAEAIFQEGRGPDAIFALCRFTGRPC